MKKPKCPLNPPFKVADYDDTRVIDNHEFTIAKDLLEREVQPLLYALNTTYKPAKKRKR